MHSSYRGSYLGAKPPFFLFLWKKNVFASYVDGRILWQHFTNLTFFTIVLIMVGFSSLDLHICVCAVGKSNHTVTGRMMAWSKSWRFVTWMVKLTRNWLQGLKLWKTSRMGFCWHFVYKKYIKCPKIGEWQYIQVKYFL